MNFVHTNAGAARSTVDFDFDFGRRVGHVYLRYQRRVSLLAACFFCSRKTPYMSASAVGGQPGT